MPPYRVQVDWQVVACPDFCRIFNRATFALEKTPSSAQVPNEPRDGD
jgi:hypothetical protein